MLSERAMVLLRVGLTAALVVLAALACTDGDDDDGSAGAVDASVGGTDGGGGTGGGGQIPECEGGEADPASCLACARQGLVQGKLTEQTCEYLGIPYAKPPVGELRWTAPQPADSWSGTLEATEFGTTCVQGVGFGDLLAGGASEKSEDCLSLNVWTPVTPSSDALPVMVFIHGGGYSSGATNTYPGYGLSEKGPVVVVSMNYRLAALAFFAHPDLDAERPDKPSGSDGIRDQQLALQWVQDNIASFGGDPDNVTVFGESAGASSVCIHMVSPLSRGLARRYIMESGTCLGGVASGIGGAPREEMYALTGLMADELCPGAADPIQCLRALPAEEVMTWVPPADATGSELEWRPVIEGEGGVLPEHPADLIESGDFTKGEVIIGTNKNEYGLFQILRGGAQSMEELRSRIETSFGDRAEEIMAVYAPDENTDPNQAYIDLMTDIQFRCGSRRLARMVADQGGKVYLYSFEQGLAMHASELPYVFYPAMAVPESDMALIDAMQQYWTSFAVDGDPNGEGLVEWPVYDTAGDRHLILAVPVSAGSDHRRAECDFWDSYLSGQ
jgi:para-nitrobenzyl esterase